MQTETDEVGSPRRVIGYFSKALTANQMNWDSSRVEAYALLQSLRHFRYLVVGGKHKLTVLTDCKMLLWLEGMSKGDTPTTRYLARVAAEVDSYGPFDLVHVKGTKEFTVIEVVLTTADGALRRAIAERRDYD